MRIEVTIGFPTCRGASDRLRYNDAYPTFRRHDRPICRHRLEPIPGRRIASLRARARYCATPSRQDVSPRRAKMFRVRLSGVPRLLVCSMSFVTRRATRTDAEGFIRHMQRKSRVGSETLFNPQTRAGSMKRTPPLHSGSPFFAISRNPA